MADPAQIPDTETSPQQAVRDALWLPRQIAALDTRRSRFVTILRVALPALAMMLASALWIWPAVKSTSMPALAMKVLPELVMDNPHFTGIDSKNRPYSIVATRARQVGSQQNVIDLEKPQGEIALEGGAWIAGRADKGRYDQGARRLWFAGDVEVFHDRGMQVWTSEANVDLNENVVWGTQPVRMQGNFGQIEGEGFRMLDGGKVVIVTGHSRAVIASNKTPGAAK
jgi:lipopolysaccharide export system protein LptC